MKNTTIAPTLAAIILVSAMFLLAIFTSGCTNVHELRGDKQYAKLNYSRAIESYEKVGSRDISREARLKLADSYRRNNETRNAEAQYRKISYLPENGSHHQRFAEVLLTNQKYADARKLIRIYLRAHPEDEDFRRLLASCDSLPVYREPEPGFQVEVLPSPINRQGSNFGTAFYQDGIVFASERPNLRAKRKAGWTGQNFLDLFFARKSQLGEWSEPVALDRKLNSPYHEGVASFGNSEGVVFFTRNNFYNGRKRQDQTSVNHLQMFYSEANENGWGAVKPFAYNSRSYSTGHPSLAQDGHTLYFISDMPGGLGGTDIWVTHWENGEFSEPVNLGPEVNTNGNEMFPNINPDGTLYFASNGHPGLGGLDVFRARYKDGVWADVTNLRAPINSSRDDFAFVMDDAGKSGFLSSNRNTDNGTDEIFSFERRPQPLLINVIVVNKVTRDPIPNADVVLEHPLTGKKTTGRTGPLGEFSFPVEADERYQLNAAMPNFIPDQKSIDTEGMEKPKLVVLELEPIVVKLEGVVLHTQTRKPIARALVELTDHRDKFVRKVLTDAIGAFEFDLEPGALYTVHSSKKLYNDDYEEVSTLQVTSSETIQKELFMEPFEMGKEFVLEDIYYDFDKWNIREGDAQPALDRLAVTLQHNPEIDIELGSHTDSRGTHAYNIDLSDKRAKSAVEYLVARGVDRNRMTYRGYGETKLTNGCADGVTCSEEDHQANRRTTFQITGIHQPQHASRK
jgi:outer membrane protein OmpA-like peptidoglycan-associated protein/tetratricopeptide (TPR) repeat protein